tara:strand:- start:1283 stop:1759 length:477 start_codon:yes stop_codon:yes gene_type:complete
MTDINWNDKLARFEKDVELDENLSELLHRMGSKNSARSTVYQLSKRYPEYIWSYKGDVVKVFLPDAPHLLELAKYKWRKGCRERGKTDLSFSIDNYQHEDSVYRECLEEIADLYNYINIAYENKDINEKDLREIEKSAQVTYNMIRKAFEVSSVDKER